MSIAAADEPDDHGERRDGTREGAHEPAPSDEARRQAAPGHDGDPVPEDLHEWTGRGVTVAEARQWIDHGFLLDSAERWRTSGVYTAEQALAWRTAGLTPYTVRPLLRAGMTPRDAVRWHELGYGHAEAAERHLAGENPRPRRWWWRLMAPGPAGSSELDDGQHATLRMLLGAGVPAFTARAYLDTGWSGEEAVPWAGSGTSPTHAALYRVMGFTPAEAADLGERGEDPAALLARWWDAGVPRAEVPSWVVAGFTVEEARRARAAGTTAEQAAVLRALGGGQPPDQDAP
ncbi:hypothetical protein [Actinoalloteichus caeruleus]|uniref:Uncharacterized protein n=1 Tax=Actinoalloteichus caeruleus DSM 43889 TaxID=1120930 RepID=A0ABT1JF52_ACTCY|nr:hypothetical protein [Actinoalloteichus caeruleus]MCP2331137.1 hypothetical protein [Actinoalloteichus caeruleus DSM 43889]